ncbi:hypothetical protein [Sphingobacterium spiritivorum]|uniref:hypothetical protein n=1 Tax=Sphingobacterium spiritivorum TaxID=258 RepID=UPI001F41566F|nr:hypothetical protein [Sphingobacterium spiritivorum]
MKNYYTILILLLVTTFSSCSKNEASPPHGMIDIAATLTNGDKVITGDEYIFCDIAVIPIKDFPKEINKNTVYHIFSDMPKHVKYATKDFTKAVPSGDYTLLVQVIAASDNYKSLIGTYSYKRASISEDSPFKDSAKFDLNNKSDFHPWK